MTSETAVFDAGPLTAFHQINRLALVRIVFGRVIAPMDQMMVNGFFVSERLYRDILDVADEAGG